MSRLYTKLNKAVFGGGQRPTLIFGIDHPWLVNYALWGLRLDERTAEWPEGVQSWTLEAVVQTDRDATFTNHLKWR